MTKLGLTFEDKMPTREKIPYRGEFGFTVRHRTKGVIEVFEDHNLVVDQARDIMARMMGNDTLNPIGTFAIGTNADSPLPDNEELTDIWKKNIDSISFSATLGKVTFYWSLAYGEANGVGDGGFEIGEYGLYTGVYTNDSGRLFARKARGIITKNLDLALSGYWSILF